MNKFYALIGATVGGSAGWWLGAYAGLMTATMLSVLGSGIGMYATYRLIDHYLD